MRITQPTETFIKQLRTHLAAKIPRTRRSRSCPPTLSRRFSISVCRRRSTCRSIGNNHKDNFTYATDLLKRIRTVPGIADLRIQQVFNYPQLNVDVDRTLAGEVGLTQRDVANSLLVTSVRQQPG